MGMIYLLSDDLCSHFEYFFKNTRIFKLVVSLQDSSDVFIILSFEKAVIYAFAYIMYI